MRERARFEREIKDLELEFPSSDLFEQFKKEIDDDKEHTCNKLDADLMRKLINFNKELKKYHLYIKSINRCHRKQDEQAEWHYARMVTWTVSEIQTYVRAAANSQASALEIKKNALELYKEIYKKNHKVEIKDDNVAIAEAKKLSVDKEWGPNPVAAVEYDCPCGCRWPRSAHTFDAALAVDMNIYRNLWGRD